jgi:hypothetical protein
MGQVMTVSPGEAEVYEMILPFDLTLCLPLILAVNDGAPTDARCIRVRES